jgi:hypothetical protein
MGRDSTTSQIGCVFRAAPHRLHAVKTLALATLSLLCLRTEALVAEPSMVCRDEVAAVFERLKTPPYRKVVTFDVSDHFSVGDRIIFRGTAEFLPPDRMREIKRTTTNGVAGWTDETIRVGQRVWSNWGASSGDGANGTPSSCRGCFWWTSRFLRTPYSSVSAGSNSRARRISDIGQDLIWRSR